LFFRVHLMGPCFWSWRFHIQSALTDGEYHLKYRI
jgi:hypothetical protein